MRPLLEEKVAIVTGSGRGIGKATAELLAAEGARVLVTDLDGERARETVSAIQAAGGTAQAMAGDVSAPDFPARLIHATQQAFGKLDILVIIRAAAPLLREAAKQEAAAHGAASTRKIVNISSTSGTRGNFGQSNYAAAKAGIIGLTKTLAREWGRYNIQVNCVAFGLIDTRLTRNKERGETIRQGAAEIELGIPADLRAASVSLIPLGRPGTPHEAASAILFLASSLSDYVSGQVLEVAGGL